MWILPKTLTRSNGSLVTVETISDLDEQSQICASSLLVKSKPTPPRTWSRKWNKVSWTAHLSGRIAKPSPRNHSVIELAFSSLPTPVRDSALPENDWGVPIPGTCGPTSATLLDEFARDTVSSRTSPGTSRWDSPLSSVIWKKMVTQLRAEYSARRKSALLTSASVSLSSQNWTTPNTCDAQNMSPSLRPSRIATNRKTDYLVRQAAAWPDNLGKNWRTPVVSAAEHPGRATAPGVGQQLSLPQQANMWPTPAARDVKGANSRQHCLVTGGGQKHMDQLANYVVHAPVSKHWRTPTTGSPNSMRGSGQSAHTRMAQGHTINLQDQVADFPSILPAPPISTPGAESSPLPRRLNPLFVEWLMGIPTGWTDCDFVATASCPTVPKKPSAPFTQN